MTILEPSKCWSYLRLTSACWSVEKWAATMVVACQEISETMRDEPEQEIR